MNPLPYAYKKRKRKHICRVYEKYEFKKKKKLDITNTYMYDVHVDKSVQKFNKVRFIFSIKLLNKLHILKKWSNKGNSQ